MRYERTLALIEERADDVNRLAGHFREQQTMLGGEVTAGDKADLRQRLENLSNELDRYLATEYGVDLDDSGAYDTWRASHQPFHWFVDFYGIMHKGGFDVVVGNPPFVEYRKVMTNYRVRRYETLGSGNLCYFLCERAITLLKQEGYWSLITPVASISSERTASLRAILKQGFVCWISSFSNRPAKLFDGVEQRIAIFVSKKICQISPGSRFSSGFRHWYSNERPALFDRLSYVQIDVPESSRTIPKSETHMHVSVLTKLESVTGALASLLGPTRRSKDVVYYHNGPTYWVRATSFDPNLADSGSRSSHYVALGVRDDPVAGILVCILNSNLFYLYFKTYSNCRDLTMREIETFPLPEIPPEQRRSLQLLSAELMRGYRSRRSRQSRNYPSGPVEYYEYYPHQLKSTIDRIDGILAELYGFTADELDYIVEYQSKYR